MKTRMGITRKSLYKVSCKKNITGHPIMKSRCSCKSGIRVGRYRNKSVSQFHIGDNGLYHPSIDFAMVIFILYRHILLD